MYELTNRAAALRNVQNMLGLNESGIYDTKTKNRVLLHQKDNSLQESGVIDYLTFLSIVREYNNSKLKYKVSQKTPFRDGFPYKKGDFGDEINILNSMIRKAINEYRLNSTLPRGPYYSDATIEAVRELRGIFMLSQVDFIDEEFYDRLFNLIN